MAASHRGAIWIQPHSPGNESACHGDGGDLVTTPGNARAYTWLGALRQMALCDGVFGVEEQGILDDQLARLLPGESLDPWPQPADEALVACFGKSSAQADDFIRTALAVALSDGLLSVEEVALLKRWGDVLEAGQEQLLLLPVDREGHKASADALAPLRHWLDDLQPDEPSVARFLIRLIPPQCPLERDVTIFGRKLLHIPPMCRINPLYEELMALRFRALCFLEHEISTTQEADQVG